MEDGSVIGKVSQNSSLLMNINARSIFVASSPMNNGTLIETIHRETMSQLRTRAG